MNNFVNLLQNKKIVALTSFTLILIVSAIGISLTGSQQKQNTANITTQQPAGSNPNQNITQINNLTSPRIHTRDITPTATQQHAIIPAHSISEFSIKDWVLSDNDIYTFQYPTDWKLERTLFPDGQTVSLIPQNTVDSPFTPTWSITVTKTNPTNPINNKENLYLASGFQKDTTALSNQIAERLNGIFPPNSTDTNAVQETNIYLAHDNYSYIVSYKYPGKKQNLQYEELFKKISNTVSIEY